MADLLDFLRVRDKEFLTGTYYPVIPTNPTDDGERIHYEEVSGQDKQYAKLLENLEADKVTYVIKTDEEIDFKINGYVATQDGELWQISAILKQSTNYETQDVLRILRASVKTEKIIRLIQIENPWELS